MLFRTPASVQRGWEEVCSRWLTAGWDWGRWAVSVIQFAPFFECLVGRQVIYTSGRGYRGAVVFKAFHMKSQGPGCLGNGLFQGITRRDTSGEIWKADTETALGLSMNECDVIHGLSLCRSAGAVIDYGFDDLDSGFHLFAAVSAVDAPVYEVFAVIGNEAVEVFAQAALGTADALLGCVSALGMFADAADTAAGELGEADFFDAHMFEVQDVVESGVVDYSAAADVEAVAAVGNSGADEVVAGLDRCLCQGFVNHFLSIILQ